MIQSQCLYCQLWTIFGHVICLKLKNIWYTQRQNRTIKTIQIKLKSIENEETIIAITKNDKNNDKNNDNKDNHNNNDDNENKSW